MEHSLPGVDGGIWKRRSSKGRKRTTVSCPRQKSYKKKKIVRFKKESYPELRMNYAQLGDINNYFLIYHTDLEVNVTFKPI